MDASSSGEGAAQRDPRALASDRNAVLAELGRIAFANILDYVRVDPGGHAEVDLSRLNRDKAAAIDEVIVDCGSDGRVKRVRIKMGNKRAALTVLCRHHGLFREAPPMEQVIKEMDDAEREKQLAAVLVKLQSRGINIRTMLDGPVAG